MGFVLTQAGQLPWNVACLGIEHDAQPPHDIRASGARKARLADNLDWNARRRAECFEKVVKATSCSSRVLTDLMEIIRESRSSTSESYPIILDYPWCFLSLELTGGHPAAS
jgi:hypothetical protein